MALGPTRRGARPPRAPCAPPASAARDASGLRSSGRGGHARLGPGSGPVLLTPPGPPDLTPGTSGRAAPGGPRARGQRVGPTLPPSSFRRGTGAPRALLGRGNTRQRSSGSLILFHSPRTISLSNVTLLLQREPRGSGVMGARGTRVRPVDASRERGRDPRAAGTPGTSGLRRGLGAPC